MTETDWLTSTDPDAMLRCVHGHVTLRDKLHRALGRQRDEPKPRLADPRQLCLLACACCRRIEDLMEDDRSRKAIEVGERYADGRADEAELAAAGAGALEALQSLAARDRGSILPPPFQPPIQPQAWVLAARAALDATHDPVTAIESVTRAALAVAAEWDDPRWATEAAGPAARVTLIRDIFGNPFREVNVDPAWLRWNDSCISRIAQGIYDEGRFADLPILHDALLDAGCDDEAILAHCREPEVHVRGCWVLDLLRAVGE
jgi:hypothetical protein